MSAAAEAAECIKNNYTVVKLRMHSHWESNLPTPKVKGYR